MKYNIKKLQGGGALSAPTSYITYQSNQPQVASQGKTQDSQKLQKMEKKLELIQKSLEKMASLPLGRKAVTEFSSLQKNQMPSKEMTRGEAMNKLKAIVSSPELTKSDRDLINKFCVGSIDQSQIGHLLRK